MHDPEVPVSVRRVCVYLNSDRAMVVVPIYTMYTTLLRPPSDRSCGPRVPCSRDVAQASGIPYLIIWAEGTGVRRARYIRVVTDGADGNMIDSVYEFSSYMPWSPISTWVQYVIYI